MFSVAQHAQATNLVVVGDSFVKLINSSGVMWTAEVKEQLLERIEEAILVDAMGGTEGVWARVFP